MLTQAEADYLARIAKQIIAVWRRSRLCKEVCYRDDSKRPGNHLCRVARLPGMGVRRLHGHGAGLTGILMTQRTGFSLASEVYRDFWASVYQASD